MKRITSKFYNAGSMITADEMNDIVDAVNELHLKIDYLFYQKTDPKKAAEIMAEILGEKVND